MPRDQRRLGVTRLSNSRNLQKRLEKGSISTYRCIRHVLKALFFHTVSLQGFHVQGSGFPGLSFSQGRLMCVLIFHMHFFSMSLKEFRSNNPGLSRLSFVSIEIAVPYFFDFIVFQALNSSAHAFSHFSGTSFSGISAPAAFASLPFAPPEPQNIGTHTRFDLLSSCSLCSDSSLICCCTCP